MGFLDFLKGSGSKVTKCAHCKREGESLPFSKKLDGEVQRFCSKKCSRDFRIARKKRGRNPPSTGSSMPW